MKLAVLIAACAPAAAGALPPAPERPAGCVDVGPAELTAALATDDAICLTPGRYAAFRIERAVTVWGTADAVVNGGVVIASSHARLAGFMIDGTGDSFDREDAAVRIAADDVTVEGLTIVHPVFGIVADRVQRATIRGNHVEGDASIAMGLRGDTIRLWETDDSAVEDNVVEDGRDVVVWYSRRNHVARNRVMRGRYGTHLMYSHDNVVEDNRYQGVVVGVFVMYSHGVTLRRNLIADAGGAAGMAIGLKDSGGLVVDDNVLVRDSSGVFVDDSPNQLGDTVAIDGNVIRQCEVAVSFHTAPRGVTLEGNDFADDPSLARITAGIDPSAATWRGNSFDQYEGYDLDGDGVGDLPFQDKSASEDLIADHPELAFFRGAPALAALDAASKILPLFDTPVVVVDPAPRMSARDPEEVLDAR